MPWRALDISQGLTTNLDEDELTGAPVALENLIISENRGHIPFPGLVEHADVGQSSRMFVYNYLETLVAISDKGSVYEITREGKVIDKTDVPVPVHQGMRPTFATSDSSLVVAGGSTIIEVGDKTRRQSDQAPDATFVGYLQGYLVALERQTGFYRYTDGNDLVTWPPINQFDAENKPDRITGLLVTQFNDLLVPGLSTTEFYRVGGDPSLPFDRRSDSGEGILAPYTLCEAGGGVFGLTARREFCRIQLGGVQVVSGPIGRQLEELDDISEAWAFRCDTKGQKLVALAFPNATNDHGSRGVFYMYDYARRSWSNLYGPGRSRYPVWSFARIDGALYAGGEGGKVYRCEALGGENAVPRSFLFRSSPMNATQIVAGADEIFVNNMRLRLRRPGNERRRDEPAFITVRTRWEDGRWSIPVRRPIEGEREWWCEFGPMGQGSAFEWEYRVDDADGVPWAVTRAEVEAEGTGF